MQLGIYKYKGSKMIWPIRIRTLNLMKMLYLKMRLQAGNDLLKFRDSIQMQVFW